jgi:hypothetical protein
MKKMILMMALALCMTGVANAQNIAGDWIGTLTNGAVSVHAVLHVTKDKSGNLQATMDCIEQALADLPATSIGLSNSRLVFAVAAVKGFYDGKVDPGGAAIRGTWTQEGQKLPLDFKRATLAKPADIDGLWTGVLVLGDRKFRLVLHLDRAGQSYAGSLDSLDQGTKGIPASSVTRDGSSLTLEFKPIAATYDGKIEKNLMTIEGKWSQLGSIAPLVLKRSKYVL